jgi:hypothetical protein
MPNYKGYTPNKRTQEYCEQVARTCKSIGEFWSKHRSAATKAHMEGWIDSYTWLTRERAKRYSLDEDQAKKLIREVDKDRSSFYRYYTDQVWGEAGNYDLCIDSGRIGTEGAVQVIVSCLHARGLI